MATEYWTYDRIMETAARCRTYWYFRLNYPLAYQAACNRNWLPAVLSHCGWRKIDYHVIDDAPPPRPLLEIMNEDGCLLTEAMNDPAWPFDVESRVTYHDMVSENA